ncbi:nuclear transport factor 2 family protein [Leisingera sp. S232]|uniref:nuclear transport factor 2 family protein n=1 Tax=Leisingera sp. S232 TaxID=3415132 RepID=UPI000868D8E4|nr:hypothetical protein AB838_08490 [Rhodobacteraceae bacterium (ex Bugula neritina AB1)]
MMQRATQLQELTKGFVEAFNRHDLDAVMRFFTADAVYDDGLGNVFRGLDDIRASFAPLLSGARGQIAFAGEDYFADPDQNKVMTSWSLAMDIEGQRKVMRGLDLLVFEGDKIASKSAYCKGSGFRLDDA